MFVTAGVNNFRVGFTDAAQEGVWASATGCPGYLPWTFMEPNNQSGFENCALASVGDTINDISCTSSINPPPKHVTTGTAG